ncbi:MAG: glycosyltransferase [Candidatus Methanoperedens sp.]|nr:glycosyltransferase [Candidatus Methanoperedens sp.]
MVSKTRMQEAQKSNSSISIITPTYNSAKTLTSCLDSIKAQNYKGDIEIIIADGGSTDSTLEIAQKYTNKIYPNPLKTGEAGKAAGVKHAKNEIIALIDSTISFHLKFFMAITSNIYIAIIMIITKDYVVSNLK